MTAARAAGLLAALAIGALALPRGHADTIWSRALDGSDPARAIYTHTLEQGDALVGEAAACTISRSERARLIARGLEQYKLAATARPDQGEPHFRIARTLEAFYVCSNASNTTARDDRCGPDASITMCNDATSARRAAEMIAELEAFEARAPLDARLDTINGSNHVLFWRALARTKLATPAQLAAAARDYEAILARDPSGTDSIVIANLAETYMMIDRLDDAIDTYARAIARGAGTDAQLGLAVALDRDGRGARALDLVRAIGDAELDQFHQRVMLGATFFVPTGEVYYYEAMIEEARGHDALALQHWRAYIASNAHPQYQPGARAHVAALLARLAKAGAPAGLNRGPRPIEWRVP